MDRQASKESAGSDTSGDLGAPARQNVLHYYDYYMCVYIHIYTHTHTCIRT